MDEISRLIDYYADQHGVPRQYIHAIAHIESRKRHTDEQGRLITSPAGAIGVMQLMPQTARGLGVNPRNLEENIEGGVRYFRQRLDLAGGNPERAIAMYYAGIGNVLHRGAEQWPGVQTYIRWFWEYIARSVPPDPIHAPPLAPSPKPVTGPEIPIFWLIVIGIILLLLIVGG